MGYADINIDHTHFDWCSIDTESWLSACLGEPLDIVDGQYSRIGEELAWVTDEAAADILTQITGVGHTSLGANNTYNYESDLDRAIVYQLIVPDDANCHLYCDDVYVLLSVHCGIGDVRGGYTEMRLYKVDCLAECGWYDRKISWYVDGTHREHPDRDTFEYGYSSCPTSQLSSAVGPEGLHWSDKHDGFVGWVTQQTHGEPAMACVCTPAVYLGV